MKAIDKITGHYKALGVKKTHVPEWDLDVYSKPLTMLVKAKIKESMGKNEEDMAMHTIVAMALTIDGEKMFTVEDEQALRAASSSSMLDKLFYQLMQLPSVREMEGNSKPTKS
jgi:hypothetical protein